MGVVKMKIHELIDSKEFSFNVKFKIYRYAPPEFGSEGEGEVYLEYNSETDNDCDYWVMQEDISAINQAEDGTVEIEYVQEKIVLKIQRMINGVNFNIELLPEELVTAYFEQQHKFDIEDIISYGEMFENAELVDYLGCDYKTFLSLKEEMADEMRRNIDKYDMDWSNARDEAVRDVINKHKTAAIA